MKTGQVSGLPPRRGMEERGQDQAPSPLPLGGELLQAGIWQPVQTGPAKEEESFPVSLWFSVCF